MARAKCLVCGKTLNTTTAYRVEIIVNKRTGEKELKYKYCCSEEEYLAEEARKKKAQEDKDRVYYLICDIMRVNEILNTALWKEKVEWNKAFSDEIIAKYLDENKEHLTSMITRLDSSEYAKIRYLSTILKNSLRDFKPKVAEVEKPKVVESSFEFFEPTIEKQPKLEEQVLYDVEDDLL